MALTSRAIVNFSGGEASPGIKGRVDSEQYYALADKIENYIVTHFGGVMALPGSIFVERTKDMSSATRLIPFIFSTGDSYMLEFGDYYMRVYRNGGSVVETAVNISGATQADPCVITTSTAHGYSDGDAIDIESIVGMTELNNKRYLINNATSSTFELQDEDGNDIDSSAYTAYVSGGTTERVYEITTPYAESDLDDLKYTQQADIMYITHPDYAPRKLSRISSTSWTIAAKTYDEVDFPPFLSVNTSSTTITPSATTGSVTLTASTSIFESDHVGSYWRIQIGTKPDGYAKITAFTSATQVTATVISELGGTSATEDWYEGAWSEVQGYPRDAKFYEQRLYYISTEGKKLGIWASRPGSYEDFWQPALGEDTADDDGLFYNAGSAQVDRLLWAYPSGTLTLGSAGGPFSLSSGSTISAVTPTAVLVQQQNEEGASSVSPVRIGPFVCYVGRSGETLGQFTYSLDLNSYETENLTYLSDHILDSGVKDMALQQYPYNVLWCVRNDGTVATMTRQVKNNVKGWARQVFSGYECEVENVGIIPNGAEDQVWLVIKRTINGATTRYVEYLKPFAFDSKDDCFFVQSGLEYNVPVTITGATQAEPVVITATAHGFSNGDRVRITKVGGMTDINERYYYVANKTANTFELNDSSGNDIDGTDFGEYTSGGEVRLCFTTVTGLDHLEGESVEIFADGAVLPNQTVSSGTITFSSSISRVAAGLGYDSEVKTLNLEGGSSITGNTQGQVKSISSVSIKFLDSLGCTVGNGTTEEVIPFRSWGDRRDKAPDLFTGDKKIEFPSGYKRDKFIVVKRTQPLPSHILGMYPVMQASY